MSTNQVLLHSNTHQVFKLDTNVQYCPSNLLKFHSETIQDLSFNTHMQTHFLGPAQSAPEQDLPWQEPAGRLGAACLLCLERLTGSHQSSLCWCLQVNWGKRVKVRHEANLFTAEQRDLIDKALHFMSTPFSPSHRVRQMKKAFGKQPPFKPTKTNNNKNAMAALTTPLAHWCSWECSVPSAPTLSHWRAWIRGHLGSWSLGSLQH